MAIRLVADNYIDRATGSVYVKIGDTMLYFHHQMVVAIVSDRVLYRLKDMEAGIIYRRIRQAINSSSAKSVVSLNRVEMNDMVTGLLMKEVSDEVEKRLKQGDHDNE